MASTEIAVRQRKIWPERRGREHPSFIVAGELDGVV
jgi:hypothetical protein